SLYSGARSLRPPGIYQVFNTALNPAPGTAGNPPLQRQLVAAGRQDLRRYHVGAGLVNPVMALCPRFRPRYGMPAPAPRGAGPRAGGGAAPGRGRAGRYTPAPPGPPPQSVGGVLAWFHV